MAAPTAPILGFNGKAYYNSASYGTPTWVLITNVGDITVTDEMDEVEIPLRAGAGFMFYDAGLRKVSYGFKMMYDPADTVQTAFRTNYAARTATEFLFLDQINGTTGSAGMRVLCKITKFAREEELNNVFMVDVMLRPAYSSNVPAAYTSA